MVASGWRDRYTEAVVDADGAVSADPHIQAGLIVAGRYELVAPIGEGASATVWEAVHETLDRHVAVKFVELYGRDARALAERFLREAKVAAAVQHRNVIDILDFGQTDHGVPFMVMERLEGESLAARLSREPMPTVAESLGILLRVLSGLAAVHDAGIVHRDIKPENVFLVSDADGVYPKLLDFGISRATGDNGLESVLPTREDLVVGTPHYMSPEQARGLASLDARSDLWSVGVMLFELLTGRLPFDAKASGDVLIKVVTEAPPALEVIRPDLDQALCEIVERALTKEPIGRFRSAREMREALLAVVGDAAETGMGATPSLRGSVPEVGAPAAFELAAEEAYEDGDSGIISRRTHRPVRARRTSNRGARRIDAAQAKDRDFGPAETLEELTPTEETLPEPHLAQAPVAKARPSRVRLFLGLAAILGVAGLVAFLVLRSSGEVVGPSPPTASASAPRSTITISLKNLPADATLRVDETQHVGEEIQLVADGATHAIEVVTPDGRQWAATVQADRDRDVHVELPTPAAASVTAAARRPPPVKQRVRSMRGAARPAPMGGLLREPGF